MTLINRDYHPGNTMRSRRRLTAIADWAQASSAPPDRDVDLLDHPVRGGPVEVPHHLDPPAAYAPAGNANPNSIGI